MPFPREREKEIVSTLSAQRPGKAAGEDAEVAALGEPGLKVFLGGVVAARAVGQLHGLFA